MITVRPMQPHDRARVAQMRAELWPEGSLEEHARELDAIAAGEWSGVHPYTVLVADAGGEGGLAGFAEVSVRTRADGCDPTRPVAFLEGWFVTTAWRRSGIGGALVRASEEWGREQGCIEMASDTWLDNDASQAAHAALGFEVVDRCVHFRKAL